MDKGLHGVGGWLSLFCVALLPVGLIYVLGGLAAVRHGTHDGILGGSFLIALGILTITAFTLLFLHRRAAVNLVYTYLAAQALFWLMATLGGESPAFLAGLLTISIGWALYFHRSQRVRNTFSPDTAPAAQEQASEYRPFADIK
jgi:glucose dehydrogenase